MSALQTAWNNSEDPAGIGVGNCGTNCSAGRTLETATSDARGAVKSMGIKTKPPSGKLQKRPFASQL